MNSCRIACSLVYVVFYSLMIQVFNMFTKCVLYIGHTRSVECLDFSLDSRFLCSGSWDRTAIMWDVEVLLLSCIDFLYILGFKQSVFDKFVSCSPRACSSPSNLRPSMGPWKCGLNTASGLKIKVQKYPKSHFGTKIAGLIIKIVLE